MTQKISRTFFDYNALPDQNTRAVLRQEATAIKAAVKRTHDNIIEIGNRLIHAKEVAGHGAFMDWIEGEFQMEYRTAKRFMEVTEAFGKIDNLSNLNLPKSALYMLAAPSIDAETRGVAIELAQSGDLKTTTDAKAIIEAAKVPKIDNLSNLNPAFERENEKNEEDDFDDSDPFADEDLTPEVGNVEAAQLPGAPYDADEDLPIIEVELPKVSNSPPLESLPKETTLKQRVKNAEVLHDTLSDKPAEVELSDEDWLESLPIYRVLKSKGHRAVFVRRDLLSMRGLLEALDKFEYQARRAFDFKNPSGTPAETRVVGAASMPRPQDWQVCAPCKGNGCNRCAHSGYDVTGAGISPLRIEMGEVAP